MSHENVEIVRAAWQAYRDHDNDAALALYDPEVDIDLRYDAGVYHGIEGVRTYLGDLHVAFGEVTSEVEEWIDAGDDRVIAIIRTHGRGRGSGVPVEMLEAHLWTVRDGKLRRLQTFATKAEAVEAAGPGAGVSAPDTDLVAAIREVYRRFGEGDFRASEHLLDPSAILVLPNLGDWGAGGAGLFVGTQEIASYTRDLVAAWSGFKMEAVDLVGSGDSVLVSVHQSGVGRQSGAPTELRYFTLWSFRAGKVIRIESFRDREKAFKAAGLA